MLGGEELRLAVTDAMLARARAAHLDRARHHAPVDGLRLRELIVPSGVDQEADVEVAIADVAENRRNEIRLGYVGLRLGDAPGKV